MYTPVHAIESTIPEIDGPIYVVSSTSLIDFLLFLFCGIGALGFRRFCFFFNTNDDPIDILAIYSMMVTGLIGESCSLKIYIVTGSLCILHQFPTRINSYTPSLNLVIHLIHSNPLGNSLYNFATQLKLCKMVSSGHIDPLIIASSRSILIITK